MKVKAKIAFAGIGFGAASGEVVDLPEAIAADVIKAGYAEPVDEPVKAKKAKKKG
jgi:hypothetical protein